MSIDLSTLENLSPYAVARLAAAATFGACVVWFLFKALSAVALNRLTAHTAANAAAIQTVISREIDAARRPSGDDNQPPTASA